MCGRDPKSSLVFGSKHNTNLFKMGMFILINIATKWNKMDPN